VKKTQVGQEVDHLLLPEVAASRGAIGRKVERAQLLLEPLRVRAGGEEEDDLARRRVAGVDELAHPAGDVPRLGAAPVDARLPRGRLVGDEELDGVSQGGLVALGRRLEALELVAELGGEELVDGGEHLRT
jgi:hypothetical protein